MTTNARDEKWSRWIDWSGGECPLPQGEPCCVKYRNGKVRNNVPAKTDGGLVSAGGFDTTDAYWKSDGKGMDIIAYRYKIKEPESDMHADLEWLAKYLEVWPKRCPYVVADMSSLVVYYGCGTEYGNSYDYEQWQAARQQLGLDQPEVTAEEEEAWQAKERELIGGPRKAENFLMQAAELLAERGKQYDQPGGERSMGKTMGAFNIITGRDLTEAEGWLIMTLLKRVRQYSGQGYHKDSAEDGVTYGALEAEALESAGK